jgi:hypothetical protein
MEKTNSAIRRSFLSQLPTIQSTYEAQIVDAVKAGEIAKVYHVVEVWVRQLCRGKKVSVRAMRNRAEEILKSTLSRELAGVGICYELRELFKEHQLLSNE